MGINVIATHASHLGLQEKSNPSAKENLPHVDDQTITIGPRLTN